jgi:hypothetical protein
MNELVRREVNRLHDVLVTHLDLMDQEHQESLDSVLTQVDRLSNTLLNQMRTTFSEVNELRACTDHNVKHFEMALLMAQKANKQLIKESVHNMNGANAKILSVLGGVVASVNALSKRLGDTNSGNQGEIDAMKEKVTEHEAVMKLFDGHLSNLLQEVSLIPKLHHTMMEIVYIMNSMMGEELIKEDDNGNDDDKMMTDNANNNPPAPITKQRAARRPAGKGKKK